MVGVFMLKNLCNRNNIYISDDFTKKGSGNMNIFKNTQGRLDAFQ